MHDLRPVPTKLSVLSRLKKYLPITSIVDVGVREQTGELIQCFPDLNHFLFEPVALFFDSIETNYRKINHELFPFALSDENSNIFLVQTSLLRDGNVTHGQISQTKVDVDGLNTISCLPIRVSRFDDLEFAVTIEMNFLLKVDVDGKDLNVIKGFGAKLLKASAVIIECTYSSMIERIAFIQNMGFTLVDMVDIIYYGAGLYQFDAVLVRNDLITSELNPPIIDFKSSLWQPLEIRR